MNEMLDSSDEDDDEDESSGSEDEDSSSKKGSFKDSEGSIQDITGVSLSSGGTSELQEVVNKDNYMPFISERYESANDILEIVDKNERNFKSVAEQMI